MTKGEYRVGISFNPSNNIEVDAVKGVVAVLIDNMQPLVDLGGGRGVSAGVAQTKFEEACMWAVKALTQGERHE